MFLKYHIWVSETKEETVTLEDGQFIELNVALAPAIIMGEEVVITTQAKGQLAAVNQQDK